MSEPKFPAGWDAARVERLIADHDQLTEDAQAAEDEAAAGSKTGQAHSVNDSAPQRPR
jgi:hypothetical protein